MSHSKTLHFTVLIVFTTFVAMTYNNCGQRAFYAEQAVVPNEKLQDEMVQLYKGSINETQCENAEMYECLHKVFSEDVESKEGDVDFPCVTLGSSEVCLTGKQFNFNTKQNKAGCDSSECEAEYEFQEFSCYYKLPNMNGSFPLRSVSDQFEQALTETYLACLKVAAQKEGE